MVNFDLWQLILPLNSSSGIKIFFFQNEFKLKISLQHTFIIRPSDSSPKYVAERSESLCPSKICTGMVIASIIYNSPRLETTQMSINR